jgi:hypothetical protein
MANSREGACHCRCIGTERRVGGERQIAQRVQVIAGTLAQSGAWVVNGNRQMCYGRLAVVSDVDDGGFALNVDNELRGSAVLLRSKYNGAMLGLRWT